MRATQLAGARRPDSATGRRTVDLFVEARFALDDTGTWAAMDPTSGAATWRRYGDDVALRLVARAQPREVGGLAPLDGTAAVVPLPYYVGVRGLASALPRFVPAVVRAVTRAEVIVLRLPGVVGLLAGLACRVLRRTYSVEVVGDPVDVLRCGSLGVLGRVLAPVAGWLMRSVVRRASAALYVTESTLQRRYPPRRDATVVSISGARLGEAAFVAAGRRWRPGELRIITVGSQELPYKGHDVLLRAIQRLRSDGVALHAVVVGDGRLHRQLVDLAGQLGVDDVVTSTGAVHDRGKLLDLLDEASLFVLPSLTEGLPRALLEAMARGLPAVGSDVGGIPELLHESCLVPPGDAGALARAIVTLSGDRSAWEEQSRRNLRTARRFRSDVLDARFTDWLRGLPPAQRRSDR